MADINANWVSGLDGGTLYTPGGRAKTGILPLNINSSKMDYLHSYGISNTRIYRDLIPGVPVKNYPGVIYKKWWENIITYL